MVTNHPLIGIANILGNGTRIIEECGHDGKFKHEGDEKIADDFKNGVVEIRQSRK